jgi:acetyl-CoA/propionyl-CoA carboxylase biotin carboxyl carrier protein
MKMELSITAPHDGTVAGLDLAAGDRVARHQPLVAVTSA